MRIFMNFSECLGEIRRDLKEMGHTVHPKSYQNKVVENNPDFATSELTNYIYSVINPMDTIKQLNPTQPWADLEAAERFSGQRINPGEAYKSREEVWNEFLVEQPDGTKLFDYSYPQRFNPCGVVDTENIVYEQSLLGNLDYIDSIQKVAKELAYNPDSRQCYISIFEPMDIANIGGRKRVPCTLGYLLQVRGGELNITYLQRSSDFSTHFNNDVYLALKLAERVSELIENLTGTKYPIGNYTHWIGSLHIYQKDIKNVF